MTGEPLASRDHGVRGISSKGQVVIAHKFRLVSEAEVVIESPSAEDIERAIEDLDPRANSFFVLDRSDGSYIQIAGSRLRLTVEWRDQGSNRFVHSVLGKGAVVEDEVSIDCAVGPIRVKRHEVLTLEDAKVVFRRMLLSGAVSSGYTTRDVTQMFL